MEFILQSIIEFKFVEDCIILYCTVKQTKPFLQKYFHPCSLNQLIYANVQCREPKGSDFKEDDKGFAPLEVISLWSELFTAHARLYLNREVSMAAASCRKVWLVFSLSSITFITTPMWRNSLLLTLSPSGWLQETPHSSASVCKNYWGGGGRSTFWRPHLSTSGIIKYF